MLGLGGCNVFPPQKFFREGLLGLEFINYKKVFKVRKIVLLDLTSYEEDKSEGGSLFYWIIKEL